MGLGSFPVVTLAEARGRALDAERLLRLQINPIEHRKGQRAYKEGIPTFGELADQVVTAKAAGFQNAKHIRQWWQTLGDAYCKTIRSKPVDEVTIDDVLGVLKPHWEVKQETATRLRGRIQEVLNAAISKGYRQDNPARWDALKPLLSKPQKLRRGHQRSLRWQELPDLWVELSKHEENAAQLLKLIFLTGVRIGSALQAQWDQIDFEGRCWNVPKTGMKGQIKPFEVALSLAAVDVLKTMQSRRQFTSDNPYVFPGLEPGQPMSGAACAALLRRMGEKRFTPHGCRATFRTWAADETDNDPMIAEIALSHTIPGALTKAYQRSTIFKKRLDLMDKYAAYVTSKMRKDDNIPLSDDHLTAGPE